MDLIELDPCLAEEWHYGIDEVDEENYDADGSAKVPIRRRRTILWKRLPLHVACLMSAPIGIIELLLTIYPKALTSHDPHNGSLPIHLACSSTSKSSSSLTLIQTLLNNKATTKAVDDRGRLPLHYAILSKSPDEIVRYLVQLDAQSLYCPDEEGKTPLQYARQVYPSDCSVLGMLDSAWI